MKQMFSNHVLQITCATLNEHRLARTSCFSYYLHALRCAFSSGCSSRSSRQRNRSSRFLLGTSEAIAARVSRRPRYSDCCTSTVPHLILADGVCTSVSAVTSWHRCCCYDVIAAKTAAAEYSANTERRRRERCRGTALAVKPLVAANVSQCGSQPRLLIFPDS